MEGMLAKKKIELIKAQRKTLDLLHLPLCMMLKLSPQLRYKGTCLSLWYFLEDSLFFTDLDLKLIHFFLIFLNKFFLAMQTIHTDNNTKKSTYIGSECMIYIYIYIFCEIVSIGLTYSGLE